VPEFEKQLENLRRMLVAMASDARVVIIKLADKIDNMETLKYQPPEKQQQTATEVLEIYAPIAQRLGIGEWKGQLEDLAFPYLFHDEFKNLKFLAIPKVKDREKYLRKISFKVKRILKQNSIEARIDFRAKRLYSLYKKLEKYDNDITKIYDLVAIRIIVDDLETCYTTLGIIHSLWKPLFSRIKDYIALPKPNGYQSNHTTVFCDNGQIVEFQIRTFAMHYQAEFGVASHWIYERQKKSRMPDKIETQWLKDFLRFNRSTPSAQELGDTLKRDFFKNRIFIFTPKGDVKDLPVGATPIDFAYAVHSAVGNRCVGAKINGKIAQLSHRLENGDIVEILTKKSAKPRSDWLQFAKTHLARSNIRRELKQL
jgi:GTP pyrophosphokinase